MWAIALRGHKTALESLKLELTSCQTWVLGTKLAFSGRAVSALNCWARTSAPAMGTLK